MRRALVLLTTAAGWLACGATLPRVTPDMAAAVGVSFDTLSEGRERYAAKCGGCHPLYPPESRADAEWTREVEEMRERSKLTDNDVQAVLAYLQTMNPPEPASKGIGE